MFRQIRNPQTNQRRRRRMEELVVVTAAAVMEAQGANTHQEQDQLEETPAQTPRTGEILFQHPDSPRKAPSGIPPIDQPPRHRLGTPKHLLGSLHLPPGLLGRQTLPSAPRRATWDTGSQGTSSLFPPREDEPVLMLARLLHHSRLDRLVGCKASLLLYSMTVLFVSPGSLEMPTTYLSFPQRHRFSM